jgi:predicted nucleotidyltransferase
VLFGSLARGRWFSETSDIDLAAWGIPTERYFEAVSRVQEIDLEFAVDLVWMERCRPTLAARIAQEGIDL